MAGNTRGERQQYVSDVVDQFRQMTLAPATLPTVMPMSAAISPAFTQRYAEAAIIFDNLHSLHDVVSDILANPKVPRAQKRRTILRAAGHYRDDNTLVTTVAEWKDMSHSMGVEKMGGLPSFSMKAVPDTSKATKTHH